MAKTTLFKGVVYLSDDNYAKLVKDGVIEVGGQTITYDENMVYVTPKALGGDYYTKEEVEEKLSQTISKPLIAPTATELVAVDTTNSQTMLSVGDGLSIENGILKASGGSGGGGGGTQYSHSFQIWATINDVTFPMYGSLVTNDSTILTTESLREYLNSRPNYRISCTGLMAMGNILQNVVYIFANENVIRIMGYVAAINSADGGISIQTSSSWWNETDASEFYIGEDIVTEL